MPSFERGSPEFNEQLPGKLIGNVIGTDSNGKEVKIDSPVIAIKNENGYFYTSDHIDPNNLAEFAQRGTTSLISVDKNNVAESLATVDVEVATEDRWVNISNLLTKDSKYWGKISEALESRKTNPQDYPPETCFLFSTEPPDKVVTGVSRTEYGSFSIEWKFIKEGTTGTSEYWPGKVNFGLREGGGSCLIENDGSIYLTDFKLKGYSKEKPKAAFERLKSEEEVISRLQLEYPWFTKDDFDKRLYSTPMFSSENNDKPTELESNRLQQIYNPTRGTGALAVESVYELTYLQSRNYAKLVEQSENINHIQEYQANPTGAKEISNSILTTLSATERRIKALEFLANLEIYTKNLLEIRWQRETELFGSPIVDRFQQYIQKFVSNDTLPGYNYSGLYLPAEKPEYLLDSDVTNFTRLLPEVSDEFSAATQRELYIMMLAELMSHEIGHTGRTGTQANAAIQAGESNAEGTWVREEVWNEWKSVIYPRSLINYHNALLHTGVATRTAFPCVYQTKAGYNRGKPARINDEIGGSLAIAGMVEEMSHKADEVGGPYVITINGVDMPFTRERIEQCALATAFARREEGVFTFKDEEVVGFKTLYDAFVSKTYGKLLPHKTFEQKLTNSKDSDYLNADEPMGKTGQPASVGGPQTEESNEPSSTELISRVLYEKVLAKIASEK